MDLSIVIVSWNVQAFLRHCLESIPAAALALRYEVFVIDNGSSDGTADMLRRDFPSLLPIVNEENRGFAAANNEGIRRSHGEFILLLNPDTRLPAGSLSAMVQFMRERPDVAIAGPTLRNADGTLQPSVRRFPTVAAMNLILLKLHHLFPNLRALRRYLANDFDYRREAEVDQLMGAFFLVRRDTFDRFGLLDERFFLWFEEVDFCKRVKAGGGRIVYTPRTTVVHAKGEAFGQLTPYARQRIFLRSCRRYFGKYGSPFDRLGLALLTPLSLGLALLTPPSVARTFRPALRRQG